MCRPAAGELVGTGPQGAPVTDLRGATFTATLPDGRAVPMRITNVVAHEEAARRSRLQTTHRDYTIEYASPSRGGQWTPLYPPEAPAATAVFGWFAYPGGDHDPTPARLTFACRDGVATKCQDWGFPSWRPETARYFQACTRMARADYCGNGRSHTVDGTMIGFLDLHGAPAGRINAPPGFAPEAVWGPGGPDAPAAALCLFRTRWTTLPIGARGPCADLLPDPREAVSTPPNRYCDELDVDGWAAAGALFINVSRPIDVGVFVWSDGQGHYVTTTRFPWLGPDVESPHPPGYPEFVSIEGSAYKPDLTPPPDRGIVPLHRYLKNEGLRPRVLITTGPPSDGYVDPDPQPHAPEAWVFGPATAAELLPATRRELYLYSDGQGHYVTTTDDTPLPGYARHSRIGYLPH